jgi:hypothetical protein
MLRAFVVVSTFTALGLSATLARAQHEPPPEPSAPAAPAASEPPSSGQGERVAAPQPAPESPAAVGEPSPEQPPKPPPPSAPAQRYEGQVGGDENAPVYEEDLGKDEDKPEDQGSHRAAFPGFSIRIDPFNWLIEGRLGVELEVVAWKFITVEAVPVLVANRTPPAFNFEGRDDAVSQHSNGLGPIAGTSIGAGFWLSGKPLSGYVVRAIFTNYGFTYKASDGSGVFDRVNHTERRLVAYIGSHSRLGFFTISGGIGLGYELNQQQRCFVNRGGSNMMSATSGCPDSGELQILLDRQGTSVADLNGSFHPIYIVGRFSLGVAFD